ncbi:MAG TPA: hypothetical protein VI542_30575 [Candidatus Tectomicrobia bacterium]
MRRSFEDGKAETVTLAIAKSLETLGANAGEPRNRTMQRAIVTEALHHLVSITIPGTIVPLPYAYVARL